MEWLKNIKFKYIIKNKRIAWHDPFKKIWTIHKTKERPVCCEKEMIDNHYVDEEKGRIYGYTCLNCGKSIWDE
jgi:hypothetical protein